MEFKVNFGRDVEVTIPHGGLGTEASQVLEEFTFFSHHPTRWARNSQEGGDEFERAVVTIPHGGLGTRRKNHDIHQHHESPSHTVGSEPSF